MTNEQLAKAAQKLAESIWFRDAQGLPVKCAVVVILHQDDLPNFIGVGANAVPGRVQAMLTDALASVPVDPDEPPPTGERH